METLSLFGILKISLVIPVLLLMSILMVAVFIERLLFFSRMGKIDPFLFKRIKDFLIAGKLKEAEVAASQGKGLIAESLEAVLVASHSRERSEMDHVLTLYFQRTQSMLSRRLGLFGTLSFISPLLGLLGTVLGVMTAFRNLAGAQSSGPGVVAAGISEALYATAAGIFVAVTAALIYNYFNFKLKHVLNSLNIFGQEIALIVTLGRDV
ncbi:MAG: MotA/TolQ/ExbB proton channel family protein [Elusimicrobia bacterium]|nr:MotA/TolQ/ExbB proton channel family protein [Elusimicrobiota bacterium]